MNLQEAAIFYRNQFNMFQDVIDLQAIETAWAEEIIEQIGKPFTTVLELGAGTGILARTLATYNKKITTVELVPEMVDVARNLNDPSITALCGNFYDIEILQTFDMILYIDGFGVGEDDNQLKLLHRIHNWLNDDGIALIDIYHPTYWKKANGQEMTPTGDQTIERRYGYDEINNRMTDTWWHTDTPTQTYTQSLACYTPEAITTLCQTAKLTITAFYPGGAMDFENWKYNEIAPLSECLSYRIKVKKQS